MIIIIKDVLSETDIKTVKKLRDSIYQHKHIEININGIIFKGLVETVHVSEHINSRILISDIMVKTYE